MCLDNPFLRLFTKEEMWCIENLQWKGRKNGCRITFALVSWIAQGWRLSRKSEGAGRVAGGVEEGTQVSKLVAIEGRDVVINDSKGTTLRRILERLRSQLIEFGQDEWPNYKLEYIYILQCDPRVAEERGRTRLDEGNFLLKYLGSITSLLRINTKKTHLFRYYQLFIAL